jgi:DNA replication protein DnaC
MNCKDCGTPVDALTAPGVRYQPHYCGRCAVARSNEYEADERRRAVEQIYRLAGATPRTRAWSLETYPEPNGGRAAVAAARAWLTSYRQGEAPNLYLYGPAGSGKTGLAWGIVRELLRDEYLLSEDMGEAMGLPACVTDCAAFLADMRESMRLDYDPARRPSRVPVCVLDDIGAERPTPWTVETLGRVITARYEAMLPTIFTSNHSPDELAARFEAEDITAGARLLSRICGGATVLHLVAADRRLSEIA